MTTARQLTILVCDDTEATRYFVARTLKSEGYRILEAANGTEALKIAFENELDLAILDIHLPDMLGFEVCRQIKANPKTHHIPVLQISASFVTSKDRIHGLEGGADSYLTHPVEPPVLVATVKSLLRFRVLNENLKANEEKLNLALEIAKLGTWDYFIEPESMVLSQRAREILGLSDHEEVSLRQVFSRIPASDRFHFLRQMSTVRSGIQEKDWEIEFQYLYKASSDQSQVKWLRLRGRSDYAHFTGILFDITEAKLARAEIERSRDVAKELQKTAEAANQAKTQFLANMSHEIRTPLGAVLGYADLLTDADVSSKEKSTFLAALQRNAHLLSNLIEEVLDLSKVEADKMAVEKLSVSIKDILDDVVGALQLKAQKKGLLLAIDVKNKLPESVDTDPTKLKQILINVIGNAIKFSERGQVLISVETKSQLIVGQPVELEFNITDHGIGISEENQKNLFQPFVQADSSMSRRFGGTGLGLMLSRKLAQLLGGNLVLAESKPGVGSRFTLNIQGGNYKPQPVTKVWAGQNQQGVQPLQNLKILVVEDSSDNQFMINRFLQAVGASVETADNGRQGIEKAMRNNFDLVLMDIQMPLMNGYEATQQLRALGFQKPIIALTAHALKGERENCFKMGFNEYMTKPLNKDQLYKVLSELAH